MMTSTPPLLEVHQLSKVFGTVNALHPMSFMIEQGEIVGVVGDNGAGKSTLVKLISGLYQPTSGEIRADGVRIETVYQTLGLIDHLDVTDNLFLGRETTRGGWIGKRLGLLDRDQMRRETASVLRDLHITIPDPSLPVRFLSGGQRQAVAIGRGVMWGQHLLILDEPTAALGVEESEQVLRMIEKLRADRRMSFLIVSHNIQHIYRIADKIIVLRQGQHVITLRETSPQEIVSYIIGG